MNRGDLVAGLVLMGVGVFVMWQARTLDLVFEYGPGPGFLPFWLGVGLTGLALVLVVGTLRRSAGDREGQGEAGRRVGRALLTWGGIIGATALLRWLGFVVSFAALTLFLVFVMERRSLLTALAVAVTITAGFALIFRVALNVPLPTGPWGF